MVPPSGILAGIWARTDRERGVWRAPANVALAGITGLEYKASDQDQSDNMSLNFLREFAGRGTLVWGARTLATGDDTTWRYIPVRRLVDTVSRDVSTALRSAVFSPNTPATWESVRAAVDSYLHALWQKGGLMGNTAAEAYFVQVGKGVTMTQDDVDNGRLIVKVGLAVTRPAEFLILQHTVELAQGQ